MHNPHFAYLEYATEHHKPFVTYQFPNSKEHTTLILNKNSAQPLTDYAEIANKSGFVFTPFDTEKNTAYFIMPEEVLIGDKGFRADLFANKHKKAACPPLPANKETQANYKEQFQKMLHLLHTNELQKIILSRTLTISDFPQEEQAYTYYNLSASYPQAMVYWVYLPHLGIEWMGATPELLVKQRNNELHSLALAGTKKPEESWTTKEKEEQQMVATYISERLANFHPEVSDTQTLDTGTVQHLATHFKIKGKASQFFPLIKKLHPTPAICGLPQDKAFKAIRTIETHERNYYCGFLGPLNIEGKTATFVNLRCMQFANNTARLYVGGGLTKDSLWEREWQETIRKAETLQKFLL